jgi:hypothetical protein
MAKLAVLISIPNIGRRHCCALCLGGLDVIDVELRDGDWIPATQGVTWSEASTPFSLASCSRVMGMKDPMPQMTKTSDAQLYA